MNRKKVIFSISVFLNILFIILVFSMYSKLHISKQIASNEIQHQLIDLESTIDEQRHLSWSNPELVSRQLDKSLKTMYRSFDLINEASFAENNHDSKVISSVLRKLELYEHTELNESGEFKSQDIANFEALLATLRKGGFGQGITITVNDYEAFIEKMNALNNEIVNPLEIKQ